MMTEVTLPKGLAQQRAMNRKAMQAAAGKQAQMAARARQIVLDSGDWLSAAEIEELLPATEQRSKIDLQRHLHQGWIFAIQHEGIDYLPRYLLISAHCLQSTLELAEIIHVLSTQKNNWEMALWFASVNSALRMYFKRMPGES
ncbi:hypothetical protein [Pseudomonas sp. COR18]|uniref:hypothetical protein n=1 Tax=Pseudomonas sp. COR18 TaxID=3399680 RepID=UPI003B00B937